MGKLTRMPVAKEKKQSKTPQTREEKIAYLQSQGYTYAYGSMFEPVYDDKGNPAGYMPDWMIESYCCNAKKDWAKTLIVKDGVKPKKHLGFVEHFKRFISIIWHEKNPVLAFEWNPNAERIVEELFVPGRKFLGIAGGKSCVSGDTRILNPITGEQPTIQSLCESGERPLVQTLNGPVLAHVPFLKGRETLYEFKLSNGQKFKCTAKHRVLTFFGWCPASTLLPGQYLFGFDPCHPQSISEPDLSVHALDVHRCSEKAEDSQSDCHHSHRLCGEQLHVVRDSARDVSPLRGGALEHREYVSSQKDDLGQECEHSHVWPFSFRQSNLGGQNQKDEETLSSPHSELGTSSLPLGSCQPLPRYGSSTSHPLPISTQVPSERHTQHTDCADDPFLASEFQVDTGRDELSCDEFLSHQLRGGCSLTPETGLRSSCLSQRFCSIFPYTKVTYCRVLSITKCEEADFYDLEVPVEHHYFAEGAIHHNTSKTETLAVTCVALFLLSPHNTKCIMTAKTLKAAKGRNFGRMILAWNAAINFFGKGNPEVGEKIMPGVLKDGIIEYRNGAYRSATSGIELVASEQGGTKKAADKIVGAKQVGGTLFVNAEELATLPHGIVETCRDNLAVNEGFLFAGPFNPRDYFDASMLVAKPKDGWESITVEDDGWETDLGYCIHFDNLKSPNVLAMDGDRLWKGLYNKKDLEWDEKTHGGRNSPGFWQFVRGFWPPTGALDCIYSGQEIMLYLGDKKPGKEWVWLEPTQKLAGLDPSYVGGGDRAAAYFAEYGLASVMGERKMVLCYDTYEVIAADVTKGHDKPRMVAEGFKELCEARGVPIRNAGVDVTGAASFASLLKMIWGDGFLEVNFAEGASDAAISDTDSRVASDDYVNKRSELWYSGKPLLRSGQLKGIGPDLASEICTCMYKTIGGKTCVEKKEDMKKRTGFSPDIAESAWICLAVARERLGLVSTERSRTSSSQEMSEDDFYRWAEQIKGVHSPDLEFEGA